MSGVVSTVRRVTVEGAEDELIFNGRLGKELIAEFTPRSKDNNLWVGTNGWAMPGAWIRLEDLRGLLDKFEKRAAETK